ncbi:MAG: DUF1993 domain-containing protein [Moraxellaceae bacterium]|nr:MAG: DUF1993 domain-containing protein [Moraxellaceae bacterium]
MSISLYKITVPFLTHQLSVLNQLLTKAETHATAKKIDPAVLLQSRLFPDMFALIKQVQIATDMSKGAAARLANVEIPKFEDNEVTFTDLHARINKCIDFIGSLNEAQFSGAEGRNIQLKVGSYELSFKGDDYVTQWVLPNVFFHITTAYNILRHNGVELGKKDFLGGM